jgi:Leucine-rich repeat (LRR) protein
MEEEWDIVFRDLEDLTSFFGDDMSISDIEGIQCLINLDYVNLDNNTIIDISPLSGMARLYKVYLEGNQITDISPLAGLTNLTGLYLSQNNISDISALVSNPGIDSGDDVVIRDNPLDCDDAVTQGYIATLEERGVNLSHDCPDVDIDAGTGENADTDLGTSTDTDTTL